MTDPHREYFNRLAPGWNLMAPQEPRLKEYLLRFGLKDGDKVLDVGSGTGRTTAVIGECIGRSGFVAAQDLAESMLFEAKKSLTAFNVYFLCADIHGLPVRSCSFDKILCFSAFPHFRVPSAALSEMHRILKTGGKLLILHNCPHGKLNHFHSSLDGQVRNDRLPSPGDLSELLEAAGFVVTLATESEEVYWVEGIKC